MLEHRFFNKLLGVRFAFPFINEIPPSRH